MVPNMRPVVKFLHLCFHAVKFIFYFSEMRSLKTENEYNNTKTLTTKVLYLKQGSLEFRFIQKITLDDLNYNSL